MTNYITLKEGELWFGNVPSHWGIKHISQLYRERKVKVSDKDYPPLSVTMQGILPQLEHAAKTDAHDDRKLIKKGDFVINSRSDRRGSCGISPIDGSCSLINTVLEPLDDMNPNYYDWLFHTARFAEEFYRWGHGIHDDIWTTKYDDMKRIIIPFPPLKEQASIASFLDAKCAAIDEAMERHKKIIEKLEEYQIAVIMKSVTKGLNPDVEMKDSGIDFLGEIPKNWDIKRFKFLHIGANTGMGIDRKYWSDSEKDRFFYTAQLNPIKTSFPDFPEWKYTTKDDLLLSRNATPYIYIPYIGSVYTDHVIRTRIKSGYNKRFIYYALKNSMVYETADGVSLLTWSISIWNRQRLPIPPFEEQQQIAEYLDEICNKIVGAIQQQEKIIKKLEEYKKSIIYNAVTGKIDCREGIK